LNNSTTFQDGKRLAYFVTEDWYFCSHRLPLAIAARQAGYTVYVITRVAVHGDEIEAAGLNLIPLDLSRRGKNPITEANVVRRLTRIYKEIRPDIVHHVALKPVIYGSIAARIAGVPAVVNAMAGLGYLYSSSDSAARFFRPIFVRLIKLLLDNDRSTLILQNPDDVRVFCDSGVVDQSRVVLIQGSGVNLEQYQSEPEHEGVPIVLLASRMLWDKGVGEFVRAAEILKRSGCEARFVLAGDNDEENPASISVAQLEAWAEGGDVEWWGRCTDMAGLFAKSHIVCLPSYREGLPKVLLEAASCGRPIVTTDVPGCREVVTQGENGFLVPVKDEHALAEAIRTALDSAELRSRMGQAGRQIVQARFTIDKVIADTLAVYGAPAP
jgi:glycosyltransferase involved in cell wall biosynthesis